jgi:hypothetical protein
MINKKIIPVNRSSGSKVLEDPFALFLIFKKIDFVRQYKPFNDRKYRCDFYLPKYNTIIEIEGGIYVQGRHNRGKGYSDDCKKYNLLTMAGYKVIRLTTDHFMRTGQNQYAVSGYSSQIIKDIIGENDAC